MYWDSDIAKWIEMASYTLAAHADAALDAQIDDVVARIAKAQQPDGYFNTYFIRREPAKRWTNLRDWHELYCAGHLIEAAVAHAQATGKSTLLDVIRRYTDCIATNFGPEANQRRGYCGHPESELALVKLYRFTKERRYLDLAKFFVDQRGRQPHYFDQEAIARGDDPRALFFGTYEYSQSHAPVREQRAVVGHAVRAMYLYSAMADLAGAFADGGLVAACKTLWAALTAKRLYVTGGLGLRRATRASPPTTICRTKPAYTETCAAIGLIFWAHRLLLIERDARYADMMELALYNGALSGLALDGEHFFYENPLASRGGHRRWTWHRCPCCPPNIGRLIASLGQYVYSTAHDEAAVHLYIEGNARMSIGGVGVSVQQKTQYPWDGGIEIRVEPDQPLNSRCACVFPAGAVLLGCRSTARARRQHADGSRVCACPPALAESGRGQAVSQHAGRAYLRASGSCSRYRPGRPEARTDRLLPRRRGQRRARTSHRVAALEPRRGAVRAQSAVRRRRSHRARPGGSTVGRRCALQYRSARHAPDHAPCHSVQLLEQPRFRGDERLDS
jgi:DUF1680 family protein